MMLRGRATGTFQPGNPKDGLHPRGDEAAAWIDEIPPLRSAS